MALAEVRDGDYLATFAMTISEAKVINGFEESNGFLYLIMITKPPCINCKYLHRIRRKEPFHNGMYQPFPAPPFLPT